MAASNTVRPAPRGECVDSMSGRGHVEIMCIQEENPASCGVENCLESPGLGSIPDWPGVNKPKGR